MGSPFADRQDNKAFAIDELCTNNKGGMESGFNPG